MESSETKTDMRLTLVATFRLSDVTPCAASRNSRLCGSKSVVSQKSEAGRHSRRHRPPLG